MWAHILLGYLRTLRVCGRHPSCRHLSQLLSLGCGAADTGPESSHKEVGAVPVADAVGAVGLLAAHPRTGERGKCPTELQLSASACVGPLPAR